jgi:diadenosine tetraphosphate (Ap4A) HIT family hydrolase
VLAESQHWRLTLNRNQNFLGKCMLVLRRHMEPVPELTLDEWTDLHAELGRTYSALVAAFQPDHFNYDFMQNQDRHVHFHVVTRYASPRRFAGIEFGDPDYPGHYTSLNPALRLPDELLAALAAEIRLRVPRRDGLD